MNSKLLLVFLPAFLAACGGDNGGTGGTGAGAAGGAGGSGAMAGTGMTGGGTGGTSGGGQCVSGTLVADPVNNYTFTSDIKLTATKIAPNNPDILFDWSGLTTDFLGHTTNPATDIDSVLLVILSVSVDQLQKHINDDDGMLQTFGQGPLQFYTHDTATSAKLRAFSVATQEGTTYDDPSVKAAVDDTLDPTKTDYTTHTLMLMPSNGTVAGSGARMIQPLIIDPQSTTTTVTTMASTRLAPGANGHTGGTTGPSMSITYDVDLQKLVPVNVPAATTNIMVDWSKLTTNGLGREWVSRSITKISVGHYTQSLTDLQNQFLDLETLPTDLYSAYVPSDDPISLSGLKAGDKAFTGIDDTGTWILALFCDPRYCGNPAPWFLTILKPCN
jgi:hypothetical protein